MFIYHTRDTSFQRNDDALDDHVLYVNRHIHVIYWYSCN